MTLGNDCLLSSALLFATLEVLHGDYIWIDDAPLICEINFLSSNDQLNRWLEIDTQKDYFALIKLVPLLESFVELGCGGEL